jgi:hypothetical protein
LSQFTIVIRIRTWCWCIKYLMNGVNLVVLGDSVTWGQGLLPEHKSATLVANGLNTLFPGIQPVILAHSGAVIGRAASCAITPFPGEVPESCPSILQQIAAYSGDPGSVPFVLLDGGINDIDIRTILNPFTDPGDLSSDIQQYCYQDMGFLLTQVKARFSHPDTKIVVTSYFPILSSASQFDFVPPLLEFMGAPLPQFLNIDQFVLGDNPVVEKIVSLCIQFWQQSSQMLAKAVNDVNIGTGPRCFFANVPFTENNSVFAPEAWLFGVGPAPAFAAQDEVAALRRPQCDLVFKEDFFAREQCYRASAGHPNLTGSAQFAQAVLTAVM